jgi:hypothetical protein
VTLHDLALEAPFEAEIDGRFPYNHPARCKALIEEARTISLNATFCILDEICRPPSSTTVSQDRQRELVNEWASGFEHELKGPLQTCANALIGNEPLPWAEAVAVMDRIGNFDGQRAALSVAYFSGDCDSIEGDAALEAAVNRIRKRWDEKTV